MLQEKLDPTVERVRSKLGGGSFSTISRLLSDVLAARQTQATQISEVPSDLVAVGQQAVGAIYAAVQRQAAAKIEVIETNARKHIEEANHARAEAALEIERLEREAEQLTEAVAAAQSATHEAVGRAERAEATALAARASGELERIAPLLQATEKDAKELRSEREQLQLRLAKAETSIESMQKELLAVKQDRDAARENERRARDEAAEARGQLKALGGEGGKS